MLSDLQTADLSTKHHLITSLFAWPKTKQEWERYRLADEQIEFYRDNSFPSRVCMLDDAQVEILRDELTQLTNPEHPGRALFYEYNSNESKNPNTTLFH